MAATATATAAADVTVTVARDAIVARVTPIAPRVTATGAGSGIVIPTARGRSAAWSKSTA